MREYGLEHAAVHVKDLEWYRHLLTEVLEFTVDEFQGPEERPNQIWIGGIQLTRAEDYEVPEGTERVWHLGVRVRDRKAVMEAFEAMEGVSQVPDTAGWYRMPDGLILELVQN